MPATLATIITDAAGRLKSITETPRLDAEILLAHALKMPRARLLASLQDAVPTEEFQALLERRIAGEPIAYILGEWEFFSRSFLVEPPVLVPRPETEHLVEAVMQNVGERPAIIEIGTGTGCVAISLACELRDARITATDIRPANLALAARNAIRHEVESRIAFVDSDLFEQIDGVFDAVCWNPPYVAESDWFSLSTTIRNYEDRAALVSGPDGLDCIRRLIGEGPGHLTPEGILCFEFGAGQCTEIERLLSSKGYRDVRFINDLAGIQRVAVARRPL